MRSAVGSSVAADSRDLFLGKSFSFQISNEQSQGGLYRKHGSRLWTGIVPLEMTLNT